MAFNAFGANTLLIFYEFLQLPQPSPFICLLPMGLFAFLSGLLPVPCCLNTTASFRFFLLTMTGVTNLSSTLVGFLICRYVTSYEIIWQKSDSVSLTGPWPLWVEGSSGWLVWAVPGLHLSPRTGCASGWLLVSLLHLAFVASPIFKQSGTALFTTISLPLSSLWYFRGRRG